MLLPSLFFLFLVDQLVAIQILQDPSIRLLYSTNLLSQLKQRFLIPASCSFLCFIGIQMVASSCVHSCASFHLNSFSSVIFFENCPRSNVRCCHFIFQIFLFLYQRQLFFFYPFFPPSSHYVFLHFIILLSVQKNSSQKNLLRKQESSPPPSFSQANLLRRQQGTFPLRSVFRDYFVNKV